MPRNSRLHPGAEIGAVLFSLDLGVGDQGSGGLQAGEGEVAILAAQKRARQGEAHGVTGFRAGFQRRSAGIAQPQYLGDLVERLAGGVIDRGAEALVIANAFHREKLAMSAGNQQQQEGKLNILGQAGGKRMAFEMVDADQW